MLLNDKFQILRGWAPGEDASVDQSLPPSVVLGVPVQLIPGNIVALQPDGTVNVGTSPDITTDPPLLVYVVVQGNTEPSGSFTNKVVCARGKMTLKTDKIAPAQAFPVNGQVSYSNGLIIDAAATSQVLGRVLANNITMDGTVTVEVDL